MEITEEMRTERYHSAPPEIQFLYADKTSGKTLRDVFTYFKLDEDLYAPFAIAVGDIVLGFYEKTDLPALLVHEMGISDETAGSVSEALVHFLVRVPESVSLPDADPTLKEGLQLRPEIGGVIPRGEALTNTEEESARPLTRDELLKALSAKRTMASDIQAVRATDPNTPGPVRGYEAYRAQEGGDSKG